MERLNAYTTPAPDGKGVIVDIEGMAVDLITACKAGQIDREEFLAQMARFYDEVEVRVKRPTDN